MNYSQATSGLGARAFLLGGSLPPETVGALALPAFPLGTGGVSGGPPGAELSAGGGGGIDEMLLPAWPTPWLREAATEAAYAGSHPSEMAISSSNCSIKNEGEEVSSGPGCINMRPCGNRFGCHRPLLGIEVQERLDGRIVPATRGPAELE